MFEIGLKSGGSCNVFEIAFCDYICKQTLTTTGRLVVVVVPLVSVQFGSWLVGSCWFLSRFVHVQAGDQPRYNLLY